MWVFRLINNLSRSIWQWGKCSQSSWLGGSETWRIRC